MTRLPRVTTRVADSSPLPTSSEEQMMLRLIREMVAAREQHKSAQARDDHEDRELALLRYVEARRALSLVGGFDALDEGTSSQTLVEGIRSRVLWRERAD